MSAHLMLVANINIYKWCYLPIFLKSFSFICREFTKIIYSCVITADVLKNCIILHK